MFPETRVDPTADLDRRYTTRETMDLCMRLAGVDAWDLDVAADAESHWAPRWYSAPGDERVDFSSRGPAFESSPEQWKGWLGVDGLAQPWVARRVWCNPPFSDIEPWVRKANYEVLTGKALVVAMLLPATRTEQPWWQQCVEGSLDVPRLVLDHGHPATTARATYSWLRTHFLPGRIKFGLPGNRDGVGVGSPPFGCVLLVWRAS